MYTIQLPDSFIIKQKADVLKKKLMTKKNEGEEEEGLAVEATVVYWQVSEERQKL